MNDRLFLKILIVLLVCTISFVWSFNYIVDPYGENREFIFSGNKDKLFRDERIAKFEMLKNNPVAESFIFGSSRSLVMDPVKLGDYTNTEALNMGFSSASSSEYYLFVKFLLETRKVSNVVIGIDLFAYTEKFESNGVMPSEMLDYFNKVHSSSLYSYLSFKKFKRSWETLKKNYNHNYVPSRYTEKGQIIKKNYLSIKDDQFKLNQYIKKYVVNDNARWGSKSSSLSDELLPNLLNIKLLCEKNNVNLYLFMSPMYINQITMKESRFGQQKKLLQYIVEHIAPVYDFNAITKINIDPENFIDSFHYSYDISDFILKEIFSANDDKSFLVTTNNINDHISSVDEKLAKYMTTSN